MASSIVEQPSAAQDSVAERVVLDEYEVEVNLATIRLYH